MSVDGSIADIFPVYGSNPMWLEAYMVNISVSGFADYDSDGLIELHNTTVSLDFQDFKVHIDLIGSGYISDGFDPYIRFVGYQILTQVKKLD